MINPILPELKENVVTDTYVNSENRIILIKEVGSNLLDLIWGQFKKEKFELYEC